MVTVLTESNYKLTLMDPKPPRHAGSISAGPEKRPLVQENWHHHTDEPLRVFEAPSLTDARIIGQVTDGFGPYQFFNTVPRSDEFHVARSAIVLRCNFHLKYESPDWNVTNADTYHAGSLEDEVASLLSLCMGIRAQAGDINREFAVGRDPRGQPVAYSGDGRTPTLPPVGGRSLIPAAAGKHSLTQLAPFRSLP